MATCVEFRLSYAEERLRFALQLQQSASGEPANTNSAGGSSWSACSKTEAAYGTSHAVSGSQSIEVLHIEVQRMAADKAMLVKNMQVS